MTTTHDDLGKIWYLKKVNLFKGLSKEEMTRLAQLTQMKSFKKGEAIYLSGQPGRQVYFLKQGVVKISKLSGEGHELTLALLNPGEIFGELEAVEESARNAQAVAHSDVLICVLNRQDLLRMMESKPDVGIRLTKLIGFRRRVIENRLGNLIFRSIPQRLAALLLELRGPFGKKTGWGTQLDVPLTHEDLANLIGTARATLTEALNNFKKEGLIETEGKRITIKNPEALELILR